MTQFSPECEVLGLTVSVAPHRHFISAEKVLTVLTIIIIIIIISGGETESTWYCGHYWPVVAAPDDRLLWSNLWNEDGQAKPKYSEKTCPSATLSTANTTRPDPGRHGGKPAANRLSYGTA
jgi:hypothetical protein